MMKTVIETFQADTIGLARSEQIGLFKNIMVGAGQNTLVGKKQFTKIGEEYTPHAGKGSAHSSGKLFQISVEEKFEGTAKGWEIKTDDTLLLSAPDGYVEISKSGVRIRGLTVVVEGDAIDFRSGGPGEGSKCLRAMAASATPFVR
ncbi:hypothetical protein C8J30_11723 [Rhodobacter viridis]|uniref:Uncharacterized protein n=2 Tax=Rhodobacter viridis TaxID=1054202 RepID=A0A318TRK2_9RHOB|nr:hypothetical protein C8J30_11723 [Rhodobacter viridis]